MGKWDEVPTGSVGAVEGRISPWKATTVSGCGRIWRGNRHGLRTRRATGRVRWDPSVASQSNGWIGTEAVEELDEMGDRRRPVGGIPGRRRQGNRTWMARTWGGLWEIRQASSVIASMARTRKRATDGRARVMVGRGGDRGRELGGQETASRMVPRDDRKRAQPGLAPTGRDGDRGHRGRGGRSFTRRRRWGKLAMEGLGVEQPVAEEARRH